MSLKAIKYVITIAKEGSFSKAAEKLFISQSALSQCIKKLEEELSCTLFERHNNSLELTKAGEIFVQEGSVILDLYDKMLRRLSSVANKYEDTVHFGISPFYSKYYLPKILPSFLLNNPSIKVEISEEYSHVLESLVINKQLDFCAVPLDPMHPQLEYEVIHQEEIFLAVPKHHPVNSQITPSPGFPYIDLKLVKNEPFISLKSVQKVSEMIYQICRQAGFTPNIILETFNWDTVNMLVSKGVGIGFVPEILVYNSSGKDQPNYYRIRSSCTTRPYCIAYRKGEKLFPAAQLLIEHFRDAFKKNMPISYTFKVGEV